MSEQIEQTAAPADAVPARIGLEDFIEAVTRGVTRALAAEDDVSGYLAKTGPGRTGPVPGRPGPVWGGFIVYPPTTPSPFPNLPDLSGGQGTIVEKGLG